MLARMQELLGKRREKQPLEWPSAGSTFKRPQGAFAGKLIEDCGLRGLPWAAHRSVKSTAALSSTAAARPAPTWSH